MFHKHLLLVLFLILVSLTSFKKKDSTIYREDLKKFYDAAQVDGSFILYDQKNKQQTIYNPELINTPFLPASTFKICNSLISLETGVVKDENVSFKWDGKDRQRPEWNADTDMKNAFRNSTVWFYQELAKRVGEQRMKSWLEKAKYGNGNITGGIDGFWLWGGLRITSLQQIDFLKRLQQGKLPFSRRSMEIVKDIMIVKDTEGTAAVIRAKTGAGKQGSLYIGWYVGYITTNNNVYYFSNFIKTESKLEDFKKISTTIAYQVLKELKTI